MRLAPTQRMSWLIIELHRHTSNGCREIAPRRGRLLLIAAAAACHDSQRPPTSPPPPPPPILSAVLVGAGDIAMCGSRALKRPPRSSIWSTARSSPRGQPPYQGTMPQYMQCYDPTWGRAQGAPVRPGTTNTRRPPAVFRLFRPSAGPRGVGYYSFNVGPWHVVSMNSNVPAGEGSAQLQWLREDLAATNARCVAAIWHHPLFRPARTARSRSCVTRGACPRGRGRCRDLGPRPHLRAVRPPGRERPRHDRRASPVHDRHRRRGADHSGPRQQRGARRRVRRVEADAESRVLQLAVPAGAPATFSDSGIDNCR